MPRTRTTKKLAQRIDLEYFKRSSPLRHWKFLLSVALPALAILWLAWYGIRRDRRIYSAGSLSSSHAVLTKQCAACHLTQMGFFSEKVSDQKCQACHDGAIHHATQEFTPSCASCHADHRGAIRLASTSDANCTQCHSNLASRSTSLSFVRSITRFEDNHPEFAVLGAGRRDPGTVALNHYRHLQPNLTGPNNTRVQMVCTDCHRSAADANLAWPYGDPQNHSGAVKSAPADAVIPDPRNLGGLQVEPGLFSRGLQVEPAPVVSAVSRAYMAPSTYARTCAACHLLQFDKRLSDAVPHDTPEKVHPFVVAKLQAYIATHPADLRVPRDPSRDLPERAIPADYRFLTPPQWVAERTAEAEQLLWRKTCKECHTLVFSEGSTLPKVAPSNITGRYMPHAKFDHSRHGLVDCTSCHAPALMSQQTSDVLLPGIATCRSCHNAGAESAESRCFECHTYHDPMQRKPAHSNFSLTDLVNSGAPAADQR